MCTDVSNDASNCGGCGAGCPTNASCLNGACACSIAGQIMCSGACIDPNQDLQNCGGCGNTCKGTCTEGRCLEVLATQQGHAAWLTGDAKNLYWTNCEGVVASVSKNGGSVTILFSTQACLGGITNDDTYLYWDTWSYTGGIYRLPKLGGTAKNLLGFGGGEGIIVEGNDLYVATGGITRLATDGSTWKSLASGNLASQIAIDSMNVYWGNSFTGEVMSVPKAGGTPTALATGHDIPYGIAVDSSYVYWSDYAVAQNKPPNQGKMFKIPIGGGQEVELASNLNAPYRLVLDGGFLYFASASTPGGIFKMSINGGPVTTLKDNQMTPGGIVVDQTSVYWTNIFGGTVMKLTPK